MLLIFSEENIWKMFEKIREKFNEKFNQIDLYAVFISNNSRMVKLVFVIFNLNRINSKIIKS